MKDRCHRISQQAESITIYQLYSRGTIDEKMKKMLKGKRAIFNQLIEKDGMATADSGDVRGELITEYK